MNSRYLDMNIEHWIRKMKIYSCELNHKEMKKRYSELRFMADWFFTCVTSVRVSLCVCVSSVAHSWWNCVHLCRSVVGYRLWMIASNSSHLQNVINRILIWISFVSKWIFIEEAIKKLKLWKCVLHWSAESFVSGCLIARISRAISSNCSTAAETEREHCWIYNLYCWFVEMVFIKLDTTCIV